MIAKTLQEQIQEAQAKDCEDMKQIYQAAAQGEDLDQAAAAITGRSGFKLSNQVKELVMKKGPLRAKIREEIMKANENKN